MVALMTDRIRLIIDTDEVVREVVKRAALVEGARRRRKVSASEIVNELVRQHFPDLVAEVEQELGRFQTPPPEPTSGSKGNKRRRGGEE